MIEESEMDNDPPLLLLPYYPPSKKVDEALLLHQVSVFLMLTIDESFTKKETKRTAMEPVKPNGKYAKTKLGKQQLAQSKLAYEKSTQREAIRVARLAHELEPENARYERKLKELEKMEP